MGSARAVHDLYSVVEELGELLLWEEDAGTVARNLDDFSKTAKIAFTHVLGSGADYIANSGGRLSAITYETPSEIYEVILVTKDVKLIDPERKTDN